MLQGFTAGEYDIQNFCFDILLFKLEAFFTLLFYIIFSSFLGTVILPKHIIYSILECCGLISTRWCFKCHKIRSHKQSAWCAGTSVKTSYCKGHLLHSETQLNSIHLLFFKILRSDFRQFCSYTTYWRQKYCSLQVKNI